MDCAFCAGLRGLQAHMDDDEVCWSRIGNAELVPDGGEDDVARHPRSGYTPIASVDATKALPSVLRAETDVTIPTGPGLVYNIGQ